MKQRSKLIKSLLKLSPNNTYHNLNKFFSYKDIFIGMIDGGRGVGKTTGALLQGLLGVDKGNEFIYLRRYKPEVKEFISKDSLSPIIDGVKYVGDGAGGYTAYLDKTKLGYFLPLSISRQYKSTDFSKVTLIIFDEAFVFRSSSYRYLKNEIKDFLEFLSTVIRTRTNVKVVLLANNEDLFSPYHTYFNIPAFEGIYIDKERGIYCEHVRNSPELIALEEKTGLFKLTKDTAYGDYHYKNKNIAIKKVPIENKPIQCVLLVRLCIEGNTITLYRYYLNNVLRLYCEYRNKVIEDKYSYKIMEKGKFNNFDVDLYKKRIKKFIERFYYNDLISYNDEKGGAILSWAIETI